MSSPLSFWPDPQGIAVAAFGLISFDNFAHHILPSIARVAVAMTISAAIGLPAGYFASRAGSVAKGLSHFVSAIRYVPPTAFIGLVIVAFGLGNGAALGLITIGIAPYIAIMTADAFNAVPQSYLQVARVFRASRWQLLRFVSWPFILPRFIEALRVNVGAAWTLLVVSELVAGSSGIGYLIARAQRYLDMDRLYALIILSGVLGMIFDRFLYFLVRSTLWWQTNDKH